MMRVSNSFFAACLLIAISITQAHAGQTDCPSADKVKNPTCGVKDEESGMDVCKYRIATDTGHWVGEDPDELGKDGGSVSVHFESVDTKNDTVYCDYKLSEGDKVSAVRLSLEK
jgi:hypothetical protein